MVRPAIVAFAAVACGLAPFAFFVACGPSMPPPELNVAYGTPSVGSSSTSASSSAPRWPHIDELKTFAQANARRFVSKGHYFGRLDADIFVNPIAQPVYSALHPGSALPEGAIVVKVHRALNGEAPGPILAIERSAQETSFVEMDAFGHVKRRGRIEPCVGCHAQVAEQGELFGVPANGK